MITLQSDDWPNYGTDSFLGLGWEMDIGMPIPLLSGQRTFSLAQYWVSVWRWSCTRWNSSYKHCCQCCVLVTLATGLPLSTRVALFEHYVWTRTQEPILSLFLLQFQSCFKNPIFLLSLHYKIHTSETHFF
jgi:hypothetical protein